MRSTLTPPLALLGLALALLTPSSPTAADPKPAASIPAVDLIEPADFAARLQASSAQRPLILQVGFRALYVQAHIPGAEYAGPGNDESGLKGLTGRVTKLPKDTAIVLYCGCCPWTRCPNVAAAYEALRALGFTRVHVLHIVEDFGTNWVDPGYPVAKGE